jgi:hypothetical protein
MFDSLVKIKPAVKKLCAAHKDLPSFDNAEWGLLEDLEKVVKVRVHQFILSFPLELTNML